MKPVAFAIALWAILEWFVPRDSTDPAGSWERSGLALYVDASTGCQYLKAGLFGGITPRLGTDGKQICGENP